jgi:hypothetical protein
VIAYSFHTYTAAWSTTGMEQKLLFWRTFYTGSPVIGIQAIDYALKFLVVICFVHGSYFNIFDYFFAEKY